MDRDFVSYQRGFPKRLVLLVLGVLWLSAGSVFFSQGFSFILENSRHILFHLMIGIVSGILFFSVFSFKISKKSSDRIINHDPEKQFNITFTDLKGYIFILLVFGAFYLLFKKSYISPVNFSIVYVALGFALFLSSLIFFYSVLTLKKLINNRSFSEGQNLV
jgi:hypothetical protein